MRKKSDTPTPAVALLIEPWRRNQYDTESSRYFVRPVVIDPQDGKPRNIMRDSYEDYPNVAMLEDLEMTIRVTWYRDECGNPAWREYGPGSVEYRGHMRLDADDIKLLNRGITRAQRAMENFPVRPSSFGQFCTMLAQSLGIRYAMVETQSGGYSYSSCEYTRREIRAAEQWINAELQRIRDKVCPPATSDAGHANAA